MLTTRYRQTRKIVGEWRRRSQSRRELALLGRAERRELDHRYNVSAEAAKWFWQA